MRERPNVAETLRWYIEAGVDEIVGEAPKSWLDRSTPATLVRTTPSARTAPSSGATPAHADAGASVVTPPVAERRIVAAENLDELRRLVDAFDGCALKQTASRTVFGAGNVGARLMLIGEAPGAEEDRQGIPFVGASGQLLDRMLSMIDLHRDDVYITNTLYWRPPGNRTPSPAESISCLPFLLRQIELVAPRVLVLVGSPAAKLLLGRNEGVMRLRGEWLSYESPGLTEPIPARATFHPAYLLRSPGRKREAWQDLLAIRERLEGLDAALAPGGSSN